MLDYFDPSILYCSLLESGIVAPSLVDFRSLFANNSRSVAVRASSQMCRRELYYCSLASVANDAFTKNVKADSNKTHATQQISPAKVDMHEQGLHTLCEGGQQRPTNNHQMPFFHIPDTQKTLVKLP